jgi:hypothetical protein
MPRISELFGKSNSPLPFATSAVLARPDEGWALDIAGAIEAERIVFWRFLLGPYSSSSIARFLVPWAPLTDRFIDFPTGLPPLTTLVGLGIAFGLFPNTTRPAFVCDEVDVDATGCVFGCEQDNLREDVACCGA